MNNSLPIFPYREKIVGAVRENAVTIITAETGSGKSTQVPQYLSELGNDVIVTEPRRMAAWSLAERVAEEMDTELGGKVGFQTAFERNFSQDTSILYCTDGLELVRLLAEKNDGKQKVLIFDEVHEWNLNMETLIAWSKKKLQDGWTTKIVIMSATIEDEELSKYYKDVTADVCVLKIPGTLFPVEFEQKSDEIFLKSTIQDMVLEGRNTLVFVPGKKEITDIVDYLKERMVDAEILPLHGELDYTEQRKCFYTYNRPKVIVATNVAQTSITIPDIDAVIDTGKERRLEVENGIQGLFLNDISKADIMQRKGRAGRTKEGKYVLCSDVSFEERPDFSVPEIQRGILDQIVLKLASCNIDATEVEFFHQPSMEALLLAKKNLINLGAITAESEVTPIGYKMAKMPISAQSARIIIEAEKYGATEEAIVIAAILEMGTLLGKDCSYFKFTQEKSSDLLAEFDVWNELQKMKNINFGELRINKKTYNRVNEYIRRLEEVLDGVVELKSSSNRENMRKFIIAGMLNNIFVLNDEFGRDDTYIGEDGIKCKLNRNSCVLYISAKIVVGILRQFEYTDWYGFKYKNTVINNATIVTVEDLKELAPSFITENMENPYYQRYSDSVVVQKVTYFRGQRVASEYVTVKNHPDYELLKNKSEALLPQPAVVIDGKTFDVNYGWLEASITIDEETLRTTSINEVVLNNGNKVKIRYIVDATKYIVVQSTQISDLRKRAEMERIGMAWEDAREGLKLKSYKLEAILEAYGQGKKIVTHSDFGDGEPIYGYICFELLQNSSIKIKLLENSEEANAKTQEVIEFLYGKIIKENYSEKKFRFLKAQKGLSRKEQKVKDEFDSEVREMLKGLDINNIEERLEYLEELYQELILELKIA